MSNRTLALAALTLCAGIGLHADIVSDALLSLPAKTDYFEYDNLVTLRALPNYSTLRQRYSGKPLEDARKALLQLGIPEHQVHEVVSASTSSAFYALIAGTFSGQSVAKTAGTKYPPVKLLDTQAFCPAKGNCILFLEDSLAAFGTMAELKDIWDAHQGIVSRLSSNRDVVTLLNGVDRRAPVRGMVTGAQLAGSVSEMLKDATGWNRDWSTLSANVKSLAYSVKFDSKAHVTAALECTSRTAAALLVQMLNALGTLQSASFQNLQASSSASIVDFKADTPIVAGP